MVEHEVHSNFQNLKVVDIIADATYRAFFQNNVEDLISKTDHKRLGNYSNINQDFVNYDSFTILIDQDKLVGFSGLYSKIYPPGHARALTRTLLGPSLRFVGGHGLKRWERNVILFLMLPPQVEVAKKLNYDKIFISMEGVNREKTSIVMSERLRNKFNEDWTYLEGKYNTCRLVPNTNQINNADACWQNIMLLDLDKGKPWMLPKK